MSTHLPDLTITRLVIPPDIVAGQPVTFAVVVKNQGSAATPSGKIIGVAFHVDGPEVTWSSKDTTSLAPGATVTLTADGGPAGPTWTATAGSHTLRAIVNDVNRFGETSTANNTLTALFNVAPAPASVTKPVNTVPPVVTGTPAVGDVLVASPGTWT